MYLCYCKATELQTEVVGDVPGVYGSQQGTTYIRVIICSAGRDGIFFLKIHYLVN